jgi:hypothetical protein
VSKPGVLEAAVSEAAERSQRVNVNAAFRASVEQRLRNLESHLEEVKTRLNGLLFFIASTVVAQVLLRLFG